MGETLERIAVFASDQHRAAALSGSQHDDHLAIDVCRDTAELDRLIKTGRYEFALLVPPISPDMQNYLDIHKTDIPFTIIGLLPDTMTDSESAFSIADRVVIVSDNSDAICRVFNDIVRRWRDDQEQELQQGLARLRECCEGDAPPSRKIDRLTETLGKLFSGSCVLYNRLENGLLCTASEWNLPPNAQRQSPPEGHICFDVITRTHNKLLEVHDLQNTLYASTDPTVKAHQLCSYMGRTVWAGNQAIGSLCVVFTTERSFSRAERIQLELASFLLGIQEERSRPATDSEPGTNRFHAIFENAPVGLYRSTKDGQLLEANRKLVDMLGYPDKETLLSRNVRDIARDPEDRDNWEANATRKPGDQQSTYVGRCHDDSIIWIEDTGHAVRDKDGSVLYFEGSMADITRRVELEETLRQSQKMDAVGRLAGGFAHEFNNLLTVINGYSELIHASLGETDSNRDRILSVMQAGTRAAELVDMLLAFSRKQMIQPEYLDLKPLMSDMIAMLRRLAGSTIRVDLQCPDDLPRIKADREQIQQLIINLGLNAIAAVRDAGLGSLGEIDLICDRIMLTEHIDAVGSRIGPGPFIRIHVKDNGIGIPEDMMDLIFEPFFTTREIGKGAGLGLAAAHGIVNQNSGGIVVLATPGNGATFRVYWPIPESVDG